jgi:hypothetical protein
VPIAGSNPDRTQSVETVAVCQSDLLVSPRPSIALVFPRLPTALILIVAIAKDLILPFWYPNLTAVF